MVCRLHSFQQLFFDAGFDAFAKPESRLATPVLLDRRS